MREEWLPTLHHSSPLFTLHRSPRQEIGNRREEVAKTGHRGVYQVGCRSRLRPYPGIHEQVAEMGWQEPCGCSFRQNSGVDQRTAWLVRHLVPFGSSPLAADGHAARK